MLFSDQPSRKLRVSQIIIILTWGVVANVGVKRVDCTLVFFSALKKSFLNHNASIFYRLVSINKHVLWYSLEAAPGNDKQEAFFFFFLSRFSYFLASITKTCLYNFDPLKPHFYIVKLGFTGVYIIFLIFAQKHRLWVLVRTASPRRF